MNTDRIHVWRATLHAEDWAWLWLRIFGPDTPDDGRPLLMLMAGSSGVQMLSQRMKDRVSISSTSNEAPKMDKP